MLRRWLPWIVALGGLLGAAAWWGASALDAWRLRSALESARRAIAARSTAEARRTLADAAARWPDDGEIAYLLGACEQSLGHRDAAEAAWERVRPDSPFGPAAAMFRARLALARDRLADAEPLLLAALRGGGTHAVEALETLVNVYKIEGRFGEAHALLLRAGAIYPDRARAIKELENLGSTNPIPLDEAQATLNRASRNAPDDDRIRLGLANLATRSGRYAEARPILEECLRRRPDDPTTWKAWLEWARGAEDEGQVERALRHLPADRLTPPELISLRAWFATRAGDVERERRAHRAMLAGEPGNVEAMGRLADLALASGDADEAARLRARRAELTRVRHDYSMRMRKGRLDPGEVPAAAREAESIGHYIEAMALWSDVSRREPENREAAGSIDRLRKLDAGRPTGPSLADLLAELDAARRAPRRPAVPRGVEEIAPRFVDEAAAVGLRFDLDSGATALRHMPEAMAGGVGLIDYDGDGWLDVYAVQAGPFPPDLDSPSPRSNGDRLFHNRGDGTFEDATASSGISSFPGGYGHGVTVGDFDNDGRPDLFVTRWRRYALYRNRGDGTFEDATDRAGLGGDRDWPTSAAFADLDGDGDLDLYVCHYLKWDAGHPSPCWDKERQKNVTCWPLNFPALPDHLFRNEGGRFVDATAEAGLDDRDGRGMGVVAADLDGDGRLDLFVTNDQTANFLFRNKGGFRFEDVGEVSGVSCNGVGIYQAGMGAACGDADGDGRPDLAVTYFYNEYTALYRNRGDGIFTDASATAGLVAATRQRLGFGIAFLDADADGRLDLATANGHVDDFGTLIPYRMKPQLLMGRPGGVFVDRTEAAGPPWQVERVGRGLAAGDLDNDGRIDLLIASLDGPMAYFHNRTPGGAFLTLLLEASATHRDAVGARVEVTAGGRRQFAWRIGGGSYQSAGDPRIHLGLGDAARADRVDVTWPSGRTEHFGPLAAGSGYRLREGRGTPRPLPGFDRQPSAVSGIARHGPDHALGE